MLSELFKDTNSLWNYDDLWHFRYNDSLVVTHAQTRWVYAMKVYLLHDKCTYIKLSNVFFPPLSPTSPSFLISPMHPHSLLFTFYSEKSRLAMDINQTWQIKLQQDQVPSLILRLGKVAQYWNRRMRVSTSHHC